MKTCTRCLLFKALDQFHRRKDSKDGRRSHCATCVNKQISKWQKANRSKCATKLAKWYAANRKKGIAYVTAYGKRNPGKINAICAKRHAAKLQRTPPWLTKEQLNEIKEFYLLVKELQWLSDHTDPLEVDHIVPLQGKNVSGLHVPWNLQILPRSVNTRKGNKLCE